jgi:hypothetical protein
MEVFKIQISPGFIKSDIVQITENGQTFGVYSAMTKVLSGGTNGTSNLTGLTVPILLTQDYHDIGYYSATDGDISQFTNSCNFLFSGDSSIPQQVRVYNTSNTNSNFLQNSTYTVFWGDGSSEIVSNYSPDYVSHTYQTGAPTKYTITLVQNNTFGQIQLSKTISIPITNVSITNPYGTVSFSNNNGSWSTSPSSQNFIGTADTSFNSSSEISSNYVSVPYLVTGYTTSRLSDLFTYGYPNGIPPIAFVVPIEGGGTGYTISNTNGVYGYIIDGIQYLDNIDGKTTFAISSSGITSDMIVSSAITKNEVYMNIIDDLQLYSNLYIERGKNSALENFRRIGEVSTMETLQTYGYNFFNIVKTE